MVWEQDPVILGCVGTQSKHSATLPAPVKLKCDTRENKWMLWQPRKLRQCTAIHISSLAMVLQESKHHFYLSNCVQLSTSSVETWQVKLVWKLPK